MSLHYGISKRTYEVEKKRTLNYQISFNAINKTKKSWPKPLNSGYPIARIFCKGHRPYAGFQILTHRFDEDDIIKAPLTIRLKIRLCLSDGSVQLVDLGDIDYYAPDIGRNETTYFLEKSFLFKNINKQGPHDIWAFDIVFLQLTGGNYGNESIMDIAVDY